MPSHQACHFILTIPYGDWRPPADADAFAADWPALTYIRGQHERAASGYEHWQVYAVARRRSTVVGFKRAADLPPSAHVEATRSAAAREYVWKEDTAVPGTRFQYGQLPHRRNDATDWALVRTEAQAGRLDSDAIPPDVFVRYYGSLCRIASNYAVPVAMDRHVDVFWGPTGTGKSYRAYHESGPLAYRKAADSKWWDGYRGQEHCVIEEFAGQIPLTQLLTWLDEYPVWVERKGDSVPLGVKRYWITSNIHPRYWYPNATILQVAALERRLSIHHLDVPFVAQPPVVAAGPDSPFLPVQPLSPLTEPPALRPRVIVPESPSVHSPFEMLLTETEMDALQNELGF